MYYLRKLDNLVEMEENYTRAINSMVRAVETLHMVEKELDALTGGHTFLLGQLRHTDKPAELKKHIDVRVWQYIVNRTGIRDLLSVSERKELDKKVETNQMGEFSARRTNDLFNDFSQNITRLIYDNAKSVMDFIKPRTGHKTNEYSHDIPKKTILTSVMNGFYGGFHYYEDRLNDVHKVFSLIDGKGLPKSYITQLIKGADRDGRTYFEHEYFSFKWFKGNGNLHITYKRRDLLRKVAQIVKDNTLTN